MFKFPVMIDLKSIIPYDKVKAGRMGKKLSLLHDKAKTLPDKPGCYLFKRKNGDILYIGKAKNLKNRVKSYFTSAQKTPKTQILVSHVHDFEFILTKTEAEAFILENNLIKKHTPKYNIRLKDDKTYPYIMIDEREPFARPVYTRRPKRAKKSTIYGPFTTGTNIYEVLRILIKSFALRDCTMAEFKRRKRPCLLYQMKQCTAPCVGKISEKDYQRDLTFVKSFFSGGHKKVIDELERRMMEAAEREEFEYAAMVRDHLFTLNEFTQSSIDQDVEVQVDRNLDVVAFHVGEVEIDISIYLMRGGILLGHKNFHFQAGDDAKENKSIFLNFLMQYYSSTNEALPGRLILDVTSGEMEMLQEAFDEAIDSKIQISKPGRNYKKLYELTLGHATENQRFRVKNEQSVWVGLGKLKELLGLKETPRLLECYDIAIWQGDSPTASQIVFDEGKPDKKRYRYYHLEQREEGNNDFAMMKEVLGRRLKKSQLPDVFIVDGGKGQVSSFLEVLKEYEVDIPVVGIAKERSGKGQKFSDTEVKSSDERLIIPNRINPYILKKCPSLMKIVVQMRDEAHRFSRKLHHKAESKRIFDSWLLDVEGIGDKTAKKILENMDISLDELKSLSEDEIARKFDISNKLAGNIKSYLSKLKTS
jgi:excinuclease ABC subunit C